MRLQIDDSRTPVGNPNGYFVPSDTHARMSTPCKYCGRAMGNHYVAKGPNGYVGLRCPGTMREYVAGRCLTCGIAFASEKPSIEIQAEPPKPSTVERIKSRIVHRVQVEKGRALAEFDRLMDRIEAWLEPWL
jgi:hypothetical protein